MESEEAKKIIPGTMSRTEATKALITGITTLVLKSAEQMTLNQLRDIRFPMEEIKREYIADKELFGYRWYSDDEKSIYIAKIKIEGTFSRDFFKSGMIAYFTKDCTITHIVKIPELTLCDEIPGKAKAYRESNFDIKKGTKIQKDNTYFCLSLRELIASEGLAISARAGKVIIPLDPFCFDSWFNSFQKRFDEITQA